MREILINVEEEERRIGIIENNRLEEFYIERESSEHLVGNIYKGRVINITEAIQASFVDIGLQKNGFLHVSDIIPEVTLYRQIEEDDDSSKPDYEALTKNATIKTLIEKGQDVLVQVVKAPVGTKGVRLTTNISIPGRHIVLMPNAKLRGVSRKIRDRNERTRLKKLLLETKLPEDMGVIVRTAAAGINLRSLSKELKFLLKMWIKIQKRIKITATPGCVHSELDLVLRTIRDSLDEQINRVLVDSKREYKKIRKFVSIFLPDFKTYIELYKGKEPIFEKYDIEKHIKRSLEHRVWLKCGGYIVLDQTEALMVIDVNSGRFVKTKDLEQTAFKTNMEAAVEISRQLRLRNVGGIIIIDFIDMENKTNQNQVLKILKEYASKDKARVHIYPFSSLGLVELTRQRSRESIAKKTFQACPYCRSRGSVKSQDTISIEIKRDLRKYMQSNSVRSITIKLHPDIANYLHNEKLTDRWRNFFRVKIELIADKSLHIEEYNIV